MAIHRYINLSLPEEERLFSLNGVLLDLQSARDACRRLIAEPITTDLLFSEAILNLAIIKYGRCFNGGIRCIKFDEMKVCLDACQIEIHHFFMDYRSKHVAHSINAFEAHRIRAYLIPEERGRGIALVSAEGHYLLRPDITRLVLFFDVIEKLIEWTLVEQRGEELRLKKIIEDRYTIDQLYSMEAEFPPECNTTNIKKGRSLTRRYSE